MIATVLHKYMLKWIYIFKSSETFNVSSQEK